jgi:hypothetical protein
LISEHLVPCPNGRPSFAGSTFIAMGVKGHLVATFSGQGVKALTIDNAAAEICYKMYLIV